MDHVHSFRTDRSGPMVMPLAHFQTDAEHAHPRHWHNDNFRRPYWDHQVNDSSANLVTHPKEKKQQKQPDSNDFPEGGLAAWSTVLGAWCCIFVSVGWISCIGDFQAHYQANQLRTYSPSSIGWIPSVQSFMLSGFAPVFGHVFDSYGPRPLLVGGTTLHIAGLLLLSLCTEFYQIFLAQSVCSAIGASAIFFAAVLSVNTWFRRRRGLASGLAASGSSVGGAVGTAVIPSLIRSMGFGSTLRVVAFAYLCLLFIALLTVQSRLKHAPTRFSLSRFTSPFKEWRVATLAFAGFFLFLGFYLPYDFLVVEAQASSTQAFADILPVVLNASGVFGRIAPAWACDRLGRFNVTIASTFVGSVIVLAIWIPAGSDVARGVFAALYGIVSGALLSIVPTLGAQVCPDIKKVGAYTGAIFLATSPGFLLTLPIGGALIIGDRPGAAAYLPMKLFCGCAMFVGGAFFVIARTAHLRVRRTEIRGSKEELPAINLRIILS